MSRRAIIVVLACLMTMGIMIGTVSAAYPEHTVNLIVPFNPGGAVDVTCRFLAEAVEKELGAKIVIMNKPGGGAVIGQTFVANSAPDGYTLLAATSSLVTNSLTKDTTYTPQSFQPVAMYCFDPEIMVVSSESKYKTAKELLEASKEDALLLSTPGHSTSHHIAGMMLEKITGAKFEYVHNDGAPQQVMQVLGGYTDVGLMAYGECQNQVKTGEFTVLAVASEERSPDLPDVPTFRELGIDLVYGAWRGIAAPAGLPQPVLDKLADAFEKGINDPVFRERMAKAGYPVLYRSPEGFAEYINKDTEAVAQIFKEIGIEKAK